jgi:hypothetical protein
MGSKPSPSSGSRTRTGQRNRGLWPVDRRTRQPRRRGADTWRPQRVAPPARCRSTAPATAPFLCDCAPLFSALSTQCLKGRLQPDRSRCQVHGSKQFLCAGERLICLGFCFTLPHTDHTTSCTSDVEVAIAAVVSRAHSTRPRLEFSRTQQKASCLRWPRPHNSHSHSVLRPVVSSRR